MVVHYVERCGKNLYTFKNVSKMQTFGTNLICNILNAKFKKKVIFRLH